MEQERCWRWGWEEIQVGCLVPGSVEGYAVQVYLKHTVLEPVSALSVSPMVLPDTPPPDTEVLCTALPHDHSDNAPDVGRCSW